MKKEYITLDLKIRLLADDVLTVENGSFELDDNEGGMVTPPWFFG